MNREECINYTLYGNSLRYLGGADTSADAISFYEAPAFIGQEVVIDYGNEAVVPFYPMSLYLTGTSSWTLFEEENFYGRSACFVPSSSDPQLVYEVDYNALGIQTIKSVSQGCAGTSFA